MNLRLQFLLPVMLLGLARGSATELTFDIDGLASGNIVPQDYGDAVTAPQTGRFSYGSTGGWTPNVKVAYEDHLGSTNVAWWYKDFNDLTRVIENELDGAPGFQVVFTADPGYSVTLHSFALGNYSGALYLPSLTVSNQLGQVLFVTNQVHLSAWDSPHLHLDLPAGITGQTLYLAVNTTGLGGSSDNVGLDNLVFSQYPADGLVTAPELAVRVSQVELCWTTVPNAVYQLEYRSDLTTNQWVPLGDPVRASDWSYCTNDPVRPNEPRRFYRVVAGN